MSRGLNKRNSLPVPEAVNFLFCMSVRLLYPFIYLLLSPYLVYVLADEDKHDVVNCKLQYMYLLIKVRNASSIANYSVCIC